MKLPFQSEEQQTCSQTDPLASPASWALPSLSFPGPSALPTPPLCHAPSRYSLDLTGATTSQSSVKSAPLPHQKKKKNLFFSATKVPNWYRVSKQGFYITGTDPSIPMTTHHQILSKFSLSGFNLSLQLHFHCSLSTLFS